jgi:hypothetical protein
MDDHVGCEHAEKGVHVAVRCGLEEPAGQFASVLLYLQRHPDGYTCHFPRPGWMVPYRETVA